jgi:Bacterial Ig-like domain
MIRRRAIQYPQGPSLLTRHPRISKGGLSGTTTARALRRLVATAFAVAVLLAVPAAASADPGDLGFEGPDGTGAGAAPSGSKPEAKLWFNDGSWWASMWDRATADFYIWKLDRGTETWTRTGTRLDDRSATRADVLWDGSKLYVASHNFSESDGSGAARLYRFSYNASTDTYSLDGGFPATINSVRSETLVIDKDSTGKLWATWEQGGQVYVNRTTGSDASWGTPFVLPGATGLNGDDISTLIAFGGNKLGVMWSNQSANPDTVDFAVHIDGQSDTTWSTPEVAMSGSNLADDHLNLKTDSSGAVYAVTKTSLTGSSPLIKFLVRTAGGSWTNYNVATGNEDHTRPILVVDEEHSLFRVYMTHGQSGGPIVEKTSPMGSISWPSGMGTPVIWDASADDMNNPTSTKQNVTAESGLIVAAFEDTTKHYWHADIFGGGGPDTTPPSVTNRTPPVDATGVAVGSNVTATFSEAVTGVSGTTFTLTGPGGAVAASVSYSAGTQTATLNPNADLSPNTTYTAHLTAGITDLADNALAPVDWSFTTADVPPPGTGIAFRAASSANNATATSLVIPAPGGLVSGDVLLAVVSARGAPTITAPAGWTLVRLDINATTMRQAVFVRTAGGAEPGSYTFTLSSAQSAAGGIVAYSGVDGSSPIDAHGGQINAASTSITAPSITTGGPDRMLVGFFGTAALTTITPPAGLTERFDQTVPATNQYKVTSETGDALVAAGATGPRTALAANSAANVGQVVALRPAP